MDADLRALERRAAAGGEEALRALATARAQAGSPEAAYVLLHTAELSDEALTDRVVAAQRSALIELRPTERDSLTVATHRQGTVGWTWFAVQAFGAPRPWAPVLAARLRTALSRQRFEALLELRTLTEVDANRCQSLGDKRVGELLALPELRVLRVAGTRATDRSLKAAQAAPNLRLLDVRGERYWPQPTRFTPAALARLLRACPDLGVTLPAELCSALEDERLIELCAEALGDAASLGTAAVRERARELALTLLDAEETVPGASIFPLVEAALATPEPALRTSCVQAVCRLVELRVDPAPVLPGLIDAAVTEQGPGQAARAVKDWLLAGGEAPGLRERLDALPADLEPSYLAERVRSLRDVLDLSAQGERAHALAFAELDDDAGGLLRWALTQEALVESARALAAETREGALEQPERLLPLARHALRLPGEHPQRRAELALRWLVEQRVDVRSLFPLLRAQRAPHSVALRGLLHCDAAVGAADLESLPDPECARSLWEQARRGADLSSVADDLRARLADLDGEAAFFAALALHHHYWRHPIEPPPPIPDPGEPRPTIGDPLGLDAGAGVGVSSDWSCWALWSEPKPTDRSEPDWRSAADEPPRACALCGSLETVCVDHTEWADLTGRSMDWAFRCHACGTFTRYDYER